MKGKSPLKKPASSYIQKGSARSMNERQTNRRQEFAAYNLAVDYATNATPLIRRQ